MKEFLKAIKGDKYFHPSNFNEKIIKSAKKDIYRFFPKREPIGMYMLRGFDEGYKIPSLGIIIHPNYRGFGFGKLMLNMAIREAKLIGCKKIRLTVDEDNIIAKKLYKKAGFKFKNEVGIKQL